MTIQLGNLRYTYNPLGISGSEAHEKKLAKDVYALIEEKFEGYVENPADWAALADRLGCRVYYYNRPGCGLGQYVSTRSGLRGVLVYNIATTRWMQIRTIIHEIAHHILVMWEVLERDTMVVVGNYCHDELGHRVARSVEDDILKDIQGN